MNKDPTYEPLFSGKRKVQTDVCSQCDNEPTDQSFDFISMLISLLYTRCIIFGWGTAWNIVGICVVWHILKEKHMVHFLVRCLHVEVTCGVHMLHRPQLTLLLLTYVYVEWKLALSFNFSVYSFCIWSRIPGIFLHVTHVSFFLAIGCWEV